MKIGVIIFTHKEGACKVSTMIDSLGKQNRKPDLVIFFGNNPDDKTWEWVNCGGNKLKSDFGIDVKFVKRKVNTGRGGAFHLGYKAAMEEDLDVIIGLSALNVPNKGVVTWVEKQFMGFNTKDIKYRMASLVLTDYTQKKIDLFGHLICDDCTCLHYFQNEDATQRSDSNKMMKNWSPKKEIGWPCLGLGAFSTNIFKEVLPDISFELGGYCQDLITQLVGKVGEENIIRPPFCYPWDIKDDAWAWRNEEKPSERWFGYTFSRIRVYKRYWKNASVETLLKHNCNMTEKDIEKKEVIKQMFDMVREKCMLDEMSETKRKNIQDFINCLPHRPLRNQCER